jgi:hypothetical protein
VIPVAVIGIIRVVGLFSMNRVKLSRASGNSSAISNNFGNNQKQVKQNNSSKNK